MDSKSGVAKLGRMRTSELWLKTSENFFKICGRLSRYQMGASRYIGGHTRHLTSGRLVWRDSTLDKKSMRMGSTRRDTLEEPVLLVRKLVTQENTQMFDSARICFMDSDKTSRRPQWRI